LGPPDEQASLDLALVRDTLGLDAEHCRPFRSPHHSISAAGLIGGGAKALPGEVSLAHGGVLFLDELPEFHPQVLELLRQPLEQGEITITRSMGRNRYPARFQLLAAMNPCPCGQAGTGGGRCRCSATTIRRYQQRISGPLLDRIDLAIRLEREAAAALLQQPVTEAPSDEAEDNIREARERQQARQQRPNAELSGDLLLSVCELETLVQQWFQSACDRLELTGRGIHKALRVARTLADLAGDERVGEPALLEALSYRSWQQSP
jgi:magnesium chelatase family protein